MQVGDRHAHLRPARARAERRRRLGRASRPRVRRVLRHRRVPVRGRRLRVRGAATGTRRSRSRSIAVAVAARRPPRRPAVAPARRRLPRHRHAVLPPALPRRARSTRRSRAARTGSRTSIRLKFFGQPGHVARRLSIYVALAAFVVVVSALYLLNESRTGRAWRALREDELAAELMTMPVNRLKLLAFAIGAGVAGIAGRDLRARSRARSSRRASTSSSSSPCTRWSCSAAPAACSA